MATTSVFSVDVQDASFQKFSKTFEKYRDALDKMPAAWGKVGKAAGGAGAKFRDLGALLLAQQEHLVGAVREQGRFNRATEASERTMGKLARSTGSVARNIRDATFSLVKWISLGSIASGLLGGGGLFGIGRLAGSAASARRAAQGLGVSTGQLQSFELNFQKFFDPRSVLQNIANAKNDPAQRWAFAAMGLGNVDRRNNAELGAEMALRAKRIFEEGGENQQYAQARGLLQFYTMDDLRRLHQMSEQEIFDAQKKAAADARTLSLSDDVNRRWQDLSIQLRKSGQNIENTFINGLSKLAPEIGHLSDAFSTAVKTLLSSGTLKEWIDSLAEGIRTFADYLTSPKFKKDLSDLATGIGDFARSVASVVRWIDGIFSSTNPDGSRKTLDDRLRGIKNGRGEPLFPGLQKDYPGSTEQKRQEREAYERSIRPHPSGYRTPLAAYRRFSRRLGIPQLGIDENGLDMFDPGYYEAYRNVPGMMPGEQIPGMRPRNLPVEHMGEGRSVGFNVGNLRNIGRPGFQKFASRAEGVRAMVRQLRLYQNRDHLDTIKGIISKYAPPSENDTAAYIRNVAGWTGFKPDQHLNLNDDATVAKLVAAMSRQEGRNPVDARTVRIDIHNNTGGSAVVTTNQMVAQ